MHNRIKKRLLILGILILVIAVGIVVNYLMG